MPLLIFFLHVFVIICVGGWLWELDRWNSRGKIEVKLIIKGEIKIGLGMMCIHDGENNGKCGCELMEVPNLCERSAG